ncbi:YoaK family protein [Sphingopyxis sp. L1A2A]|uniref:YoaK family protein n=1 Tax=Sphingopyxis sp. L1A2A TaxID=2502247 RepID=UPI0010F61665|nr:YoaK family protein [Sphingopyxis sp. L1A2A]
MIRFDPSHQLLAVGVAILAGFVDAIGFVESAGFFVSFMTGNSTRLAVGLAEGQHAALVAAIIIAVFVAGVVAGALVGAHAGRRRTPAVLLGVTILLAIATTLRLDGEAWGAILSLALAMGIANAAIAGRDGAVVGVTYMTGTLVQMGQKMANALRGEGDRRWLHHFGLWAALVGGALLGARAVLWSPPLAYVLAVGLAAALALRAGWIVRRTV